MIRLKILDNGNLQIILTDKEELIGLMAKPYTDERAYLSDMLEDARYIGNNWDCLYNIGLTESPAIGFGAIYNDTENDGVEAEDWEVVWYYNDYQITSYLEVLLNEGSVTFNRLS